MRVVTVAGNIDREASVAQELSRDRSFELVLRCLERTELVAAVRGARIEAAIVVGSPRWLDRATVAELSAHGVRGVAIASDPLEAEVLRRLQLELVEPAAVGEALQDPSEAPAIVEERRADRDGRLIAVWGPKGAPGRTVVAAELACEIAANDPRSVLVDGDTYGGDLAQMFAVIDELPTIVWAAQVAADGMLDEETFVGMVRRTGADGPVLLPGINRPELWADISKFGWAQLLEFLQRTFSFTVVDVGFGIEFNERLQQERDRLARQTISQATHVIAVCRADPIGVKTFLWSFERLKEITDLDRVFVVLNKATKGEQEEVAHMLRRRLGKRPITWLPFRPLDARQAFDRGCAIRDSKPYGDIASGIRELAGAVGVDVPARGLLARLGGRT